MADAWHHRSDTMSSVGAFIGILGARLGFPILDPIASVAICVLIVKASVDIFRDAIDKMVDHSCDEATEESMREVIMGVKGVKGIDLLQTRLFGSKMYVDIEISADGEIPLDEAHRLLLRKYFPHQMLNESHLRSWHLNVPEFRQVI